MKRRLEPALTRPGPATESAGDPATGQGLLAVAQQAIVLRRRDGATRRGQTEAAFRALLQAEPCLSVERAKAIIEAALSDGKPAAAARTARATPYRAGRRWLLPASLLALASLVVAGPFALALLPFALDPAVGDPVSSLTARLALALPGSLLVFPLFAWLTLGWRHPALTRALCLAPLLHITLLAGSLVLP